MGGAAGGKPQAIGSMPQGAGGLSDVFKRMGAFGRQDVGINPRVASDAPIGDIDIPAADLHDPFGGFRGDAANLPDPRAMNWLTSMFNPPPGTPGFAQGPTLLPTTFDTQGYPYAVPVEPDSLAMQNPTDPVGQWHAGQHINPYT